MSMISEQLKEVRKYAEYCHSYNMTDIEKILYQAADTIETLSAKLQVANMERSTAHYNGGWIPCSERLPEDSKVVLAYLENGYMVTVVRKYGSWILYDEARISNVIAWRELPEPYKPQ